MTDTDQQLESLKSDKALRLRGMLAQSVYSIDLHLMQPPIPMSRLSEADFLHQLSAVLRQARDMVDDEIFGNESENPEIT